MQLSTLNGFNRYNPNISTMPQPSISLEGMHPEMATDLQDYLNECTITGETPSMDGFLNGKADRQRRRAERRSKRAGRRTQRKVARSTRQSDRGIARAGRQTERQKRKDERFERSARKRRRDRKQQRQDRRDARQQERTDRREGRQDKRELRIAERRRRQEARQDARAERQENRGGALRELFQRGGDVAETFAQTRGGQQLIQDYIPEDFQDFTQDLFVSDDPMSRQGDLTGQDMDWQNDNEDQSFFDKYKWYFLIGGGALAGYLLLKNRKVTKTKKVTRR